MKRYLLSMVLMPMTLIPVAAQELPPGIRSAEFLPGWINETGHRISALEVVLEPGWKTYWRSPGDSGLPPSFDWEKSDNLSEVQFHWPAPEAIFSGGELTLGYHDHLILPFTAQPDVAGQPMTIAADIALGVCEKICVPVELSLSAPAPAAGEDERITQALARQPKVIEADLSCSVRSLADATQITVKLPDGDADDTIVMELDGAPEIWVSPAVVETTDEGFTLTSDFVAPDGKPFPVDTEKLRITRLSAAGATEVLGCNRV